MIMQISILFLLLLNLNINMVSGATFDKSSYTVTTGETSSAAKQNNMLAAIEDSLNNVAEAQIDDGAVNLTTKVSNVLTVPNGGTNVNSLTDGAVLLGSGTSAVTALAVTTDGAILIGDGTTDPTTLSAFTSSTGPLQHEYGGLEADVSAVVDSDFIVGTGTGTIGLESGATARETMGVAIGTNVQAWDDDLDDIAVLTPTNSNFIVGDGTNWVKEPAATALSSLGISATATEVNYTTDVTSNIQAQLDNGISNNPTYDSGWFTGNINTLYTKPHGFTMTFPNDILFVSAYWRASSGGSYIIPLNTPKDDGAATGNFTSLAYNGTNIYLYGQTSWNRYRDSAGADQVAGNGEIRVIAWQLT